MRVALVRGSSCGKGDYKEMFGVSMPPLGLASLAGAITSYGHKAILVDALAQGFDAEEVAEVVESWDTQVVAVTVNASPYYEFAADLAKKVKAGNKDIAFVAGGQHATFVYPQVLKNGFDYVVLGEGEATFSELVNTLEYEGAVSKVKGLAFRKDGKIVKTNPRPLMKTLDSLPMPAFELFQKDSCRAEIFGTGSHLITMETSRGCPYNCEFCSVTVMWGHRWRFKSVERVLEELQLIKALGYNWVFIVDDNFIVPMNVKERELLFKEIEDRGLNPLNLIAQIRADLAAKRPDIIKNAANAGLRIAFLGMESGSDEVLKKMGKGTCTATATEGLKVLHRNGVLTHGGFVLGSPYESKNQLNRTFEYADQLRMAGLDSAQFSIYTPLPGTGAFFKALRCNSLLTLDWNLYDCLHPVMKTQTKPLWLYLKSCVAAAMFFLKKWISDASSVGSSPPLQDEYSELMQNISRFIAKNLAKYTKELLVMPLNALKFWSMLRKDKILSKDMLELLNQNMQP